jgi:hypothetical protein
MVTFRELHADDDIFCDLCGWGDMVYPDVRITGYGIFKLCHRCHTQKKFEKRAKKFLEGNKKIEKIMREYKAINLPLSFDFKK